MTQPILSPEAEALRRAIEEDYGKWVAVGPIPIPGDTALAYNTGHAVPDTNVQRWGYHEMDPPLVVSRDEWDRRQAAEQRAAEKATEKRPAKPAAKSSDTETKG